MATNKQIYDLTTLSKTSVDSNDYLEIANSSTRAIKKILTSSLFPSLSTTGSGSEDVFINITNKNQLNFKGIKSGDTDLLTVATTSNNIVLTALEAGIDLSLCNNVTSGFLTAMDFTGTVTGECAVSNGGTGLDTIAKGAMLYASADNVISATSAMSTNGQILIGNATTGIPSLATLTQGSGMTITEGPGTISLAATISNAESNIDMRNAAGSTTYNIDLHSNTGWVSGSGLDEGVTVDADGKTFLGEGAPTAFFDDTLNIIGGIRFSNGTAPTIKPNDTTSSTSGQKVTISGGSSASGTAGDLELNAGTAASGGGNGGHVLINGGSEAGGTAGSIKNSVYDGSGSAVEALTVVGGSATPAVKVSAGNLIISAALKGIVHEGTGTVSQGSNHSTAVNIDSTSGVITLYNVALAAGAEADFAVTNDTVKTDSVILLTVQSPAAASATNNASLHAELDEVNSESFNVRLTNPGAGNTAGIYKIHFLVINKS